MAAAFKLARILVLFGSLAPPPGAAAETADLSIHFRAHGRSMEVAPGRLYWSGIYWGGSFNNAGDGFGHKAAWSCPTISEIVDGAVAGQGYCAMTDADGDKVFGRFDGRGRIDGLFEGDQRYSGGTGKYAGIEGGHRFQCETFNITPRDGSIVELSCFYEVAYTLPK